MASKNKLQQLADLTTAMDLSSEPTPETSSSEIVLMQTDPRRGSTQPRPQQLNQDQANPSPTSPRPQLGMGEHGQLGREANMAASRPRPVVRGGDDPDVTDAVIAMLVVAGMTATWSVNHWMVAVRDAHKFTAQVSGGRRARFKTGVRGDAPDAEWMAEINRLWEDLHPGENLPFGGM